MIKYKQQTSREIKTYPKHQNSYIFLNIDFIQVVFPNDQFKSVTLSYGTTLVVPKELFQMPRRVKGSVFELD